MARFRRRALPKRVLVLPAYGNEAVQDQLVERFFAPNAPQDRRAWEAERESEARRALGRDVDVLLYCPARRMQLKEARTLVRFPDGDGDIRPMEDFADRLPRLGDLRDCYPRLWKLYVFTSESDPDARRALQRICMANLPDGASNALRMS